MDAIVDAIPPLAKTSHVFLHYSDFSVVPLEGYPVYVNLRFLVC